MRPLITEKGFFKIRSLNWWLWNNFVFIPFLHSLCKKVLRSFWGPLSPDFFQWKLFVKFFWKLSIKWFFPQLQKVINKGKKNYFVPLDNYNVLELNPAVSAPSVVCIRNYVVQLVPSFGCIIVLKTMLAPHFGCIITHTPRIPYWIGFLYNFFFCGYIAFYGDILKNSLFITENINWKMPISSI